MCLKERGPSVPFESNHPVSDGKADYLWINPPNGIVRAWTDNYPDSPAWLDSGEYAGSVVMPVRAEEKDPDTSCTRLWRWVGTCTDDWVDDVNLKPDVQ
ncbi:hypothetical protein MRS44_003998 [Fusarium solani]|uniref:uncharacterized protein n=1 Tax=Fusarium solani TaxID=169388 RepID=UPI0032C444E8|nr:hypothetical protein MRS44_003998 [Fusarium solani]